MSWPAKLLALVEGWLSAAAAGVTFLLMLVVAIQIVARYLAQAIPGVYESAELMMVAIVFLGLAYTQSLKGHIYMELLVTRLSRRRKALVEGFTLLLSLGIFVIITYKSGQKSYEAWRIGDVTMGLIAFPVWPSKVLVPIGSGLLCLRFLAQLLGYLWRPAPAPVKGD